MVGAKFLFCLLVLFGVDVVRLTALSATGFSVVALTNSTNGPQNRVEQEETMDFDFGHGDELVMNDISTKTKDILSDKNIPTVDHNYEDDNVCLQVDNMMYKYPTCDQNYGLEEDKLKYLQGDGYVEFPRTKVTFDTATKPCESRSNEESPDEEISVKNAHEEVPIIKNHVKPLFLNDCIIPDIFPENFSNLIGLRNYFPSTSCSDTSVCFSDEKIKVSDLVESTEKLNALNKETMDNLVTLNTIFAPAKNENFDALFSTQEVIKNLLEELKKELKQIKHHFLEFRKKSDPAKRENNMEHTGGGEIQSKYKNNIEIVLDNNNESNKN